MIRFSSFFLLEDKVQHLKDTHSEIDSSHDDHAQHRDAHDIIDHFASHDPHPKKIYTQWMVNQYKKKNIRQEDASSVGEMVGHFDKYKGKLEKKDINQYKHPTDLSAAVTPHLGSAASRKEEKKGGGAVIHDDGHVKVFKVRNEEEATHFSKEATRATGVSGIHSGGTASWCTVAPNMFKHYTGENNEKPLYVVHAESDKNLHKRYQLHFESNQFADANDKNIGIGEVLKRHPTLKNVEDFKGKHPVFDEPHEVAKKALNNEKYPGGSPAFMLDATSNKPVLSAKHVEEYWNNHAKHNEELHSAIVKHPNTPSHILDHMASHPDIESYIKTGIVNHPNTPSHVIDNLASHPDTESYVKTAIAKRPNLSENSFRNLVDQKTRIVNQALAENPALKTHQLDHLAKSTPEEHHEVHERIASHPNLSRDKIHEYAHGTNSIAAHYALRNPSVHPDTVESVYKANYKIHASIASSPHTPEHILHKLVSHHEAGASDDHPEKPATAVEVHGKIAADNLKERKKKK